MRSRKRSFALEEDRRQLALQLDRRINEIFSLQELSYVLAESLQLERVAEQVVRYTMRFLQADGAVPAASTAAVDWYPASAPLSRVSTALSRCPLTENIPR